MKDHPTARSGAQWRGSSHPNAAHAAVNPSNAQGQQGESAHGDSRHEVRQGLTGELALGDEPARRRAGEPRTIDGSVPTGDEHDDGGSGQAEIRSATANPSRSGSWISTRTNGGSPHGRRRSAPRAACADDGRRLRQSRRRDAGITQEGTSEVRGGGGDQERGGDGQVSSVVRRRAMGHLLSGDDGWCRLVFAPAGPVDWRHRPAPRDQSVLPAAANTSCQTVVASGGADR